MDDLCRPIRALRAPNRALRATGGAQIPIGRANPPTIVLEATATAAAAT